MMSVAQPLGGPATGRPRTADGRVSLARGRQQRPCPLRLAAVDAILDLVAGIAKSSAFAASRPPPVGRPRPKRLGPESECLGLATPTQGRQATW